MAPKGDDEVELWVVRQQLDRLGWARLERGLTDAEHDEYRVLAAREAALLSRQRHRVDTR